MNKRQPQNSYTSEPILKNVGSDQGRTEKLIQLKKTRQDMVDRLICMEVNRSSTVADVMARRYIRASQRHVCARIGRIFGIKSIRVRVAEDYENHYIGNRSKRD